MKSRAFIGFSDDKATSTYSLPCNHLSTTDLPEILDYSSTIPHEVLTKIRDERSLDSCIPSPSF
jgi:hypothetical protein